MYCPNCGSSIDQNAEICIHCGVNVHNFNHGNSNNSPDKSNIWINLLSLCCIPILGIIMYFVWKDKQPKAAKSALTFGIIGLVLSFIFAILSVVLGIFAGMVDDSYYYY